MVTKGMLLFYLPFSGHLPVVSLGPVSSSFLLSRRRRQGQSGCLVAVDVNPQSPPGPPCPPVNKGNVCPNEDQGCKKILRNGRVAQAAVRLLERDQGMKRGSVPLPSRIQCGSLFSAIRSVFPDLTPVQELSLKTSKKLYKPCPACWTEEEQKEMVENYKIERFRPLSALDVDHLARFKKACAQQVRTGWNLGHYPYIPTGNATKSYSRLGAGSWNKEEFSKSCGVMAVVSSGKPRIVTLYSSKNSEILSPLHDALYRSLQREGWLLVGSPTDEKVKKLSQVGPYVSVDYKNATDNIRAEYCRAVIGVLKEKSIGLSDEQRTAMDVVGELRFEDDGPVALRGQPMGSLMSFPMLCLINKVCVDLALADLLEDRKITWKQFCAHRCLINGDDLLYREFDNSRGILAGILRHGSKVGLVVNEEKTMVSDVYGEINSCVFKHARKQKKTNVSVVEWRSEVSDPVGFIADSVCKPSTFRQCLDNWRHPIRRAWPKLQGPIPPKFMRELWRFKAELTSRPLCPSQKTPNPFPVVTKPAGYDLTREEEVGYISERVARLREECANAPRAENGRSLFRFAKSKRRLQKIPKWESVTISRALRNENTNREDTVLKHLADGWERKQKEKLCQVDPEELVWVPDPTFAFRGAVFHDGSLAPIGFRIISELKDYKRKRMCATSDAGMTDPGTACAVSRVETDFLSVDTLPIGA
uniref:RNA-dependent RNA polymerase n=1 Tax=Exserohilum turcicum ourmia-like virus 1 TaxID=3229040 RepID=A0AAU7YDV5_9VIRU